MLSALLIINTLFILASLCFSVASSCTCYWGMWEGKHLCILSLPWTSTMALLCLQYKFLLPPAADKAVHVDLSSPNSSHLPLPLSVCALMGQGFPVGNFRHCHPQWKALLALMHSSLTSSFRFQLHILRDSCLSDQTRADHTAVLSLRSYKKIIHTV